MLFLLLLPFLVPATLGKSDVFVNYTLHCDGQDIVSYEVDLYEADLWPNPDDHLSTVTGVGSSLISGINQGKVDGDGIGSHYEFALIIKHDCRASRRLRRVDLMPPCHVDNKVCSYYNVRVDLVSK